MNKQIETRIMAACKRVIKGAIRPALAGVLPDVNKDGYAYICNGYQIIRLANYTPNLPPINHPNAEEITRTLPDMVEDARKGAIIPAGSVAAADIKTFMKEKGGNSYYERRKQVYKLSDDYYVAAGLFLDMLEALPGAEIMLPEKPNKPCYFKADNGDGILLPVRVNA